MAIETVQYKDFIEYQRDNYKAVIESWQRDKKETVSQWLDRLLA